MILKNTLALLARVLAFQLYTDNTQLGYSTNISKTVYGLRVSIETTCGMLHRFIVSRRFDLNLNGGFIHLRIFDLRNLSDRLFRNASLARAALLLDSNGFGGGSQIFQVLNLHLLNRLNHVVDIDGLIVIVIIRAHLLLGRRLLLLLLAERARFDIFFLGYLAQDITQECDEAMMLIICEHGGIHAATKNSNEGVDEIGLLRKELFQMTAHINFVSSLERDEAEPTIF
jgi:hypothetical protein